jgi:hypothetical protein
MNRLWSTIPHIRNGFAGNVIGIRPLCRLMLIFLSGILPGHFDPKDGQYVTSIRWLALLNLGESTKLPSSKICFFFCSWLDKVPDYNQALSGCV